MQIVIAEEKHATRYLDASDDQALARSALKLLTERLQAGYWYHEPEVLFEPAPGEELLTQEQVDALPTQALRDQEAAKVTRAGRRGRAEQDYRRWYDEVKRFVETKDLSMVTVGRGRFERLVPKVWLLLEERSDYEYESVELEGVEEG
jgi:hypothetical protein